MHYPTKKIKKAGISNVSAFKRYVLRRATTRIAPTKECVKYMKSRFKITNQENARDVRRLLNAPKLRLLQVRERQL